MTDDNITKQDIAGALAISVAIAGAIREAGSIPVGHLYVSVMGKMSLESFTSCIDLLVQIGAIEHTQGHVLVWKGPKS